MYCRAFHDALPAFNFGNDCHWNCALRYIQSIRSSSHGGHQIGLVFYAFPLLGVIFAPLAFFYWLAAIFYRRTSIETKRLDRYNSL
jgi:hypothetical protein